MIRILINYFVRLKLRITASHFTIGKGSIVSNKCIIKRGNSIICGANCSFADGSVLIPGKGFINIGNNVTIGLYNVIDGTGGLTIKDNVRIGAQVCIYSANHNYSSSNVLIREQGMDYRTVVISEDCWIGANSTILAGVTIWKGAVIAAGAVVTKDVPEYSVVAGVPARVIKKRQ